MRYDYAQQKMINSNTVRLLPKYYLIGTYLLFCCGTDLLRLVFLDRNTFEALGSIHRNIILSDLHRNDVSLCE
jgi:hypothetical protein